MRKNYVQNIVIHEGDKIDKNLREKKIGEFYFSVLERNLHQLPFTTEQKVAVIEKMMEQLERKKCDKCK